MAGLTDKQIATHAGRLLDPMTKLVAKKLGQNAADHAGSCLYDALKKYDTERSEDLDQFVRNKTLNLVKDTIRELDGRKGTARYEANRRSVQEFDAYDAVEKTESVTRLEKREQLAQALNTMNGLRAVPRWLLLAKMFGDFTNVDLTRILNVSERQLCRESAELRQLLSVN